MKMLYEAFKRVLRFGGKQLSMTPRNVVFITGCDSGLGFFLATYCHSLNMTVISACHNVKSKGAKLLQKLDDAKRMLIIEIDLLKPDSILNSEQYLNQFLNEHTDYKLTALVNNAAMLCMGEYEWQTWSQIEMQINVNLLGTMKLTKLFLPMLRKYKARIINITSHCGLQALPGFSVYAASKSGLRFWNDSLRIEMQQYGVEVINFIPGSFVMSSNIMARQMKHADKMLDNFSEEQRQFYGTYFKQFNNYLKCFAFFKEPDQMNDKYVLKEFHHALTNTKPKSMYIIEPMRYRVYRILFRFMPTPIVDWLTVKFCILPTYHQTKQSKICDKRTE